MHSPPLKQALTALADFIGKPLIDNPLDYGFREEHDIPGVMRTHHTVRGASGLPDRIVNDDAGWHYAVFLDPKERVAAIQRLYPKRWKFPVVRQEVAQGYRDRASCIMHTGEEISLLGGPLRAVNLPKWSVSGLESYPTGIRLVLTKGLLQITIGWNPKEDIIYSYEVGVCNKVGYTRLDLLLHDVRPIPGASEKTPITLELLTERGRYAVFVDYDTGVEAVKRFHANESCSVSTDPEQDLIELSAIVTSKDGIHSPSVDALLWG